MNESDCNRFMAAVDRLWRETGPEKISTNVLKHLYWYLKFTGQDDTLHIVGMALLRRGECFYLSSDQLRRGLAGMGDRIEDTGLLDELIEASSEEAVCRGLSKNKGLSDDLRMEFAKRALEYGSDRSRITYAELLSGSKDADYLEVMRQCLMVREQCNEFR